MSDSNACLLTPYKVLLSTPISTSLIAYGYSTLAADQSSLPGRHVTHPLAISQASAYSERSVEWGGGLSRSGSVEGDSSGERCGEVAQLNSHPSRMVRPACAASRGVHIPLCSPRKGWRPAVRANAGGEYQSGTDGTFHRTHDRDD